MPFNRFFVDAPLSDSVHLQGAEFHHLTRVMRIGIGEKVELVNGKGALGKARVVEVDKHRATLQVLQVAHTAVLPPQITLAIPLMRPSKLELVIEKCTELGADAFLLFPAHYSEKEDLSENQRERLQHIAIAAMKQCGRLDLPPIHLTDFEEIFALPGTYLFGDTRPQAKPIPCCEAAVFITGPEKGFSEKELQLLDQKGLGVRLHKNTLRAETAPITATCLLSTF